MSIRNFAGWAGLAFLLAVPVPVGVVAAAELQSLDVLVTGFRQVVFKTEEGEGYHGKPVVKWRGPIAATLHGDAGAIATYRKDVEKLFADLSKLTNMSLKVVEQGEPANMKINFMPTAEIRRIIKQPQINCYGSFQGSKTDYVAMAATIYISTDAEQKTRHCIPEEITQVLGLTNDTPLIPDSLFNDNNTGLRDLSLSDRILLRTLYDRRIKPGMSAEEAMPIARTIIAQLRGKLLDAQQRQAPQSR